MRPWRRASGALKDKTSIWHAKLTRRTPDIDKAVIRATSHHDSSLDRRNIDRICEWVRLSPLNLKPILWSITARVEKTQDWAVALKGLQLMHAVMSSNTPCVRMIGRLPFDLSGFKDAHASAAKAWPLNAFVQSYYAYLDQKSAIMFLLVLGEERREGFSMRQELLLLQKLQNLADLLVEIKPAATAAFVPLILDVMDGIIFEVYDVYSRIWRGISIVLVNISSAGKLEAAMALSVVKKAKDLGDDLTFFFEFCREIGVVNASEFPLVDQIPDEGIRELEHIIQGFRNLRLEVKKDYEFRTIVTDDWERFEEDFAVVGPPLPDLITLI